MTRLGVLADPHIGAGTDHRVDALADQEQTLDRAVEAFRVHQVDAVLLPGDVFHRPKPIPAELHVFARFARSLESAAIPAIAILGNAGHDQLGTDLPTALELFANGEWLRVSRHPEMIRAAGDVAICTLPSVPPGRLRAMLADRGQIADTSDLAAALLVDVARDLRAQVPDGWPSILTGHWSVSGASLPNGLPVATMTEPVLPLDELEALGFDAIALGHIHRGQLFGNGRTLYAGSPMVHDFGEAGFDHGVWILDVDDVMSPREPLFVPLVDRRFVTVAVDLVTDEAFSLAQTGEFDETDAIAAALMAAHPLVDAVVRVTYTGTEEQHRRVDHAALTGFLEEAGIHKLYGGLHWEPVRETRARAAGVDEQLDPLAGVDAWCKANDIPEDVAVELRQTTRSSLEVAA